MTVNEKIAKIRERMTERDRSVQPAGKIRRKICTAED